MYMGLNPPGTTGDAGSLCFVYNDPRLGYKAPPSADAGKLIYKAEYQVAIASKTIVMTWYPPCNDLDILAFWTEHPENSVGFGASGDSFINIGYRISWDGDDRGTGGSEIVRCECNPWTLPNRVIEIHFNYYSSLIPMEEDVPEAQAIDITSPNIEGWVGAFNVVPSNTRGRRALVTDPGVRITFNDDGSFNRVEYI